SLVEGQLAIMNEEIASSTAVAVAMGGTTFLPDQNFSLSANIGTYDGAHAGSFSIGALVSENVAVNAGVATGFNRNGKTAGRVGVTIGF
ncbi:MAG: YadA-like family protein, partial [Pseudomonadota bacterium]